VLPGGTDFTSLSDNLAGDSSVELAQTVLWGLLLVVVGASVGYAAWRNRRHRWMIYGVGAVGMLAALWFFFGALSPLLPDSF
jgi:bacteriorhodopsin